jgi:hypothetical protein
MRFNRRFLYAALTSTFALLLHVNAPAQSEDRSKTIKEIASLRKQLNEKEKLFLSPSSKDLAAFAEFLKQPNTGLARILPRGLYEDRLTIRGGGAYYSFTRLTHEYGYGSDIELQPVRTNDFVAPPIAEYNFQVGFAGANYGFIVTLGDVPIEKVTLDHDGVKFLVDYDPPSAEPQARSESRRAREGVGKNGYSYKNVVPAVANYTYALRSIDYNTSDVLVAFRVVRKEIDGSVVILWKRLKQFSRPDLIRTVSR